MNTTLPRRFQLGPFQVDAVSGDILGPHGPVRLYPRAMAVLVFLAERPGRLVTRARLLDSVWAGENVSDHALTHAVSEIRHALRDQAHAPAIIQTLPKILQGFVRRSSRAYGYVGHHSEYDQKY